MILERQFTGNSGRCSLIETIGSSTVQIMQHPPYTRVVLLRTSGARCNPLRQAHRHKKAAQRGG